MPIWSASPGKTVRIGAAATPATPASRAARPKTSMKTRRVFTPRTLTMSGSETAARTMVPRRVRNNTGDSSPSTARDRPMMNRR